MKKFIFTISIVIVGIIFYFVQGPMNEIRVERGLDRIFSDDSQVRDFAKEEKFTVHMWGVDQGQGSVKVGIEKPHYREQTEEYFRDLLDANGLASYEIKVFVGTEQLIMGDWLLPFFVELIELKGRLVEEGNIWVCVEY